MSNLTDLQKSDGPSEEEQSSDAKKVMALGAGVGALGIGAAVVSGAVCPICVVVAPTLMGAGFVQHLRAKKKKKQKGEE